MLEMWEDVHKKNQCVFIKFYETVRLKLVNHQNKRKGVITNQNLRRFYYSDIYKFGLNKRI